MSRYSIFGYYGHGNAGDEAILAALINGIKNQIPNAKIVAYSANPEETKSSHKIESYKFFSLRPTSFIKGIFGRRRRSYINSLVNFFKTDTVIIGGGGIFFDTPNENKWIFSYIDLIKTAKFFGKKIAVIGVSVGPIHKTESAKALVKALKGVDLVSVRDQSSKNLLAHYNFPTEKIHVTPDLVFTLDSCKSSHIQDLLQKENLHFRNRKIISLTPCCYNRNKLGWIDQYTSFCRRAIKELGANIIIVPMQRNGTHNDHEAAQEIFNSLDADSQSHTFILQGLYTAQEVQGILSNSDFILAERLHGSIMAINTATPFMSIAYMPKVNGVLNLANLNNHMITMEDFLSGEYETKTFEFIKSEAKKDLLASRDQAKALAYKNIEHLKNIGTI